MPDLVKRLADIQENSHITTVVIYNFNKSVDNSHQLLSHGMTSSESKLYRPDEAVNVRGDAGKKESFIEFRDRRKEIGRKFCGNSLDLPGLGMRITLATFQQVGK
uniref:Uncharacterized protein n=1 Tax=Clastoptera arizonana TaxID=38151 RepID=A0A1B6DY77_9HEMI